MHAALTPLRMVVMGVSGCGKSTLAQALAQRLDLQMRDGDDLHLPASVAKMSAGIALDDSDRWPWLDRVGDYLADSQGAGRVVACSALKRSYRNRLRARAGTLVFVFLNGDAKLIAQRMAMRVGHYMQAELLDSQFSALEKPQHDETDAITVGIGQPIEAIVAQVLAELKTHTAKMRLAA
jgi:gluconokinase